MHWDSIFENLTGIMIPLLFIAAVLGILLSSILYAVYTVVPEKLKSHFVFHHRVYFKAALVLIPIAGCLFGAATAYYAEWWSHQFDPIYIGVGEPWWTIFGAPGDMIANSYGGDWQADEAWNYRGDIMFWNGLFWTVLASVALMTFRVFVRLISSLNFSPTIAKPPLLT